MVPMAPKKSGTSKSAKPKHSTAAKRAHTLIDEIDTTVQKLAAAEKRFERTPAAKKAKAEARVLAKKAQSGFKKIVTAAKKRRAKR
ncbi:MAG: hypothetical protein ACYDCK_08375 [Thermoplasmatota archaeon]